MGAPLWHGRFASPPADELLAFTASLPFDRRLGVDDVVGSRAHVRMLARVGLLTDGERDAVLAALDTVDKRTRHLDLRVRRRATRTSIPRSSAG